jgi:hypothetical protein
VHEQSPRTTVLRGWSETSPAACKEAAIAAIGRGARIVIAHGGRCAQAAAAGAHDRNLVAFALEDFELPEVAAAQTARDALGGVYHGGEDIVFGARSGVIGIRRLDPRISPEVAVQARAVAQELVSGRRRAG